MLLLCILLIVILKGKKTEGFQTDNFCSQISESGDTLAFDEKIYTRKVYDTSTLTDINSCGSQRYSNIETFDFTNAPNINTIGDKIYGQNATILECRFKSLRKIILPGKLRKLYEYSFHYCYTKIDDGLIIDFRNISVTDLSMKFGAE